MMVGWKEALVALLMIVAYFLWINTFTLIY